MGKGSKRCNIGEKGRGNGKGEKKTKEDEKLRLFGLMNVASTYGRTYIILK